MKKTREFHYTIKGYDKAPSAVIKATENVEHAKLEDYITVSHEDFFSTKKEKNGTGLGLSIVQSVIHEHSAQIVLNSTHELTTFTVQFKKM